MGTDGTTPRPWRYFSNQIGASNYNLDKGDLLGPNEEIVAAWISYEDALLICQTVNNLPLMLELEKDKEVKFQKTIVGVALKKLAHANEEIARLRDIIEEGTRR